MTGRLAGKCALVTGASSGLGKATALQFGREGARVAVAARREADIESTAAAIREAGGEAIAIRADVSVPDEVEAMVETVMTRFGALDIAFNNAGVFPTEALIHEISIATFDTLVGINLKGTWLCMKAELARMVKQGSGVIVNMASSAGVSGWSDNPLYSATKHAVVGLTRSAALQYAPLGIRINVVCPAFTEIEAMQAILAENPHADAQMRASIPLGRIGRASETAEAVTWLASDAASFCVGHTLVLDGGQTIGLWQKSQGG